MENNRTKRLSSKNPFYYQDIINYIKNQNNDITKTKIETKTIYQKIIQEESKQHTIAGETQWERQIPNIHFETNMEKYFSILQIAFYQRPTLHTSLLN